ncbi:hypothetical protein PENFLA_c001G04063 [Penicillium flavigenum]|uniref:HNH nuclease domain-containing protein n=1 Tax=Penicillium flavigenum TaxID=254877 RepID=A0A1V6U3C1_9EURO|nr:hypothetical protein PENFLA_c001G04063 [Penicillium flavigenum]
MPPPASLSRSVRFENSQPRTDISNTFSDTVKLEVTRLSGVECWSCSITDPEFAHVVAQEDGQVQHWREAGLFPFSLKAAMNCIQLCPTCYTAYACFNDPRWVFLPTDLNFFIRHEIEDQQRRAQADLPSGRIVPTAKDYHDHLASKDLVPHDAIGGLYRGYYLNDFFRIGRFPIDFLKLPTTPKPWHGHPLATIRRGIAILGSARCYALGRTTIDELTTLRDLYFNNKNLIDAKLVQLYHLSPADNKRKRSDKESDQHEKKPKLTTNAGNDGAVQDVGNSQDARHVRSQAEVSGPVGVKTDVYASTEWVLGPSATGNDAINRFAPVLQSIDVTWLLR